MEEIVMLHSLIGFKGTCTVELHRAVDADQQVHRHTFRMRLQCIADGLVQHTCGDQTGHLAHEEAKKDEHPENDQHIGQFGRSF